VTRRGCVISSMQCSAVTVSPVRYAARSKPCEPSAPNSPPPNSACHHHLPPVSTCQTLTCTYSLAGPEGTTEHVMSMRVTEPSTPAATSSRARVYVARYLFDTCQCAALRGTCVPQFVIDQRQLCGVLRRNIAHLLRCHVRQRESLDDTCHTFSAVQTGRFIAQHVLACAQCLHGHIAVQVRGRGDRDLLRSARLQRTVLTRSIDVSDKMRA
jgi:hypothetical protein